LPTFPGLDHVVVAGGTPAQWAEMSTAEWNQRLDALAAGVKSSGAHWVTLLPHHGPELSAKAAGKFSEKLMSTSKVVLEDVGHCERFVWRRSAKQSIIVDPSSDGHRRFASIVESMRTHGVAPHSVDEDSLTHALLAPATQDADLVLVLGPPDRMPESMVWELAYCEIVFIDLDWSAFTANHLELAIDDFNRRHRRFGGLDS
jgi:undecaprenyl diphosphate synthase